MITDALVDNFDQALGLIASAVGGGGSKAAYLHGSFGSGKSHFMAVLYALLKRETAARARDEFAGLIAKYDSTLAGRNILLVPFHLLGAKSLEQRVLGGYVEHVHALHPEAPIPAVHRTDALLDNARELRARLGDAQFIAGLPGAAAGQPAQDDGQWGRRRPPPGATRTAGRPASSTVPSPPGSTTRCAVASSPTCSQAGCPASCGSPWRTARASSPSTVAWARSPPTPRASATTGSCCSSTS